MSTPESTFVNISLQSYGWKAPICANSQLGLNCTVSRDPCIMAQPCLYNGTCLSDNVTSYECLCTEGFSGTYCEINMQPCQSLICLDHCVCIEKNLTTFECQCLPGYEGDNCEINTDYCQDVTCQNNGQCRSLLLNFTCECLTTDFTGLYCEIKSSSLTIHQIINNSLASVAILAIVFVLSVVILMDFLKYFFHIDPSREDRVYVQRKREKRRQKRLKPKRTSLALHFIYVNPPENSSSTQLEDKTEVEPRVDRLLVLK